MKEFQKQFKNKIKEVEFWVSFLQRIVSLVLVVVPAVYWIIGAIDKKIDAKLEPINSYFVAESIFNVDKQYQKISTDHEDIKSIDISWTIDVYDGMNKEYKTPLLEKKIEVIRNYALKRNLK